ncbi:nuclear transport factor 2, partial [Calycina marina]
LSTTEEFTKFYYDAFDVDRKQLAPLYRDQSMLTFESASSLGTSAIIEKLDALPFKQIKHVVTTLDAQPASPNGAILILITGQLLVDEEQKPMSYTQTFQLLPENGSYFIFNDIFKLVYG